MLIQPVNIYEKKILIFLFQRNLKWEIFWKLLDYEFLIIKFYMN